MDVVLYIAMCLALYRCCAIYIYMDVVLYIAMCLAIWVLCYNYKC